MERIRVMIVDDHPVVREGIAAMLSREDDLEIVGDAFDGYDALLKVPQLRPDVILMDLQMPRMDGVEAMNRIREVDTKVKFIVLTTYDTDEFIFRGIEAGARGYLLKDAPRDELCNGIRAVFRGESLIQPMVATKLLNRFAQLSRPAASRDLPLTDREKEVLQLVAEGLANKEIAARMNIGRSTVKTHLANIFEKLGVNDRTEAVTSAIKKGLLKL